MHESGLRHSAFTFGCESLVTKTNINGAKIPPGELVNLVQRGIMYTELERSVADDKSPSQPASAGDVQPPLKAPKREPSATAVGASSSSGASEPAAATHKNGGSALHAG